MEWRIAPYGRRNPWRPQVGLDQSPGRRVGSGGGDRSDRGADWRTVARRQLGVEEAALHGKAGAEFYRKVGGHLRGYLTRAGGKVDERTIDESIDGGCTLSHITEWKINKRTPDSNGGIVSILEGNQNQCDQRPGGILSSGMARIGIDGVAETGGTVGTPNFESVSRPLAVAGMLPQGRLAGEHVHSTNLFGIRPNGLVAICFYVIGLYFDSTETIVAQVRSINPIGFRISSK